MKESQVASQEISTGEENWQFYYLRRKQSAERMINRYLYGQNAELSDGARLAVEHGLIITRGKRVRSVLTYLVHDLVGGSSPLIDDAAVLSEFPHRGSLLEDDIDDNAIQRDGYSSAHEKFGLEATKEAINFLYMAPFHILTSLPIGEHERDSLIAEYRRLSVRARVGQQKDVEWGSGNFVPTLDEYLQMCEEKCAAFEYAIRVGAHFGGASVNELAALVTAGNKTAIAFQLVDDLIGLREGSDDYGSDITEGKKTVPVIATVRSGQGGVLMEILNQHTNDPALISQAIETMSRRGGISFTQQVARKLVDESRELISENFENSRYRRILFSIMEYGLQRNE